MTTPYERSWNYSQNTLVKVRKRLEDFQFGDRILVICGSYARREASKHSDIDFFLISENTNEDNSLIDTVGSAIREVVPHTAAKNGPFQGSVNSSELLQNIGGENDDNRTLTRRILLLLEGEWLFNEEGLRDFRRKILERYIRKGMKDHQLALFLLNDIIRYYRTIAVDYEFKTYGGEDPKPWGIRNIKLVFSRKLLYASGLFSIAMTADRRRIEKISILEELFTLPVMERMTFICGETELNPVLRSYNIFLERLADSEVQDRLNKLQHSNREDSLFRELKNEGHQFTRQLLKLFENTFDSTHPIRRAVVF